MDRGSAFRAFLLLACVIICSNVLCPVGAFLYNNRYAGWVKTPIHLWGSRMPGRLPRSHSAGKAHGWREVFCRDPHTRRRALSHRMNKGSLYDNHRHCFGKCSCLRHNMVFSAYSRLILLSDGIWDKTANELQREAFRLRMIGTDGTGDACSDSGLSNCSNYSIKKNLSWCCHVFL